LALRYNCIFNYIKKDINCKSSQNYILVSSRQYFLLNNCWAYGVPAHKLLKLDWNFFFTYIFTKSNC